MTGEPDNFKDIFASLCDIAALALRIPTVLVPQGRFDLGGLKGIQKRLKTESYMLDPAELDWEPASVLERAVAAITIPHHSLIFALRGNVPVFSPIYGSYYAAKNRGSLRSFGLEDWVVVYEENPQEFENVATGKLAEFVKRIREIRAGLLAGRSEIEREADQFDREFFEKLKTTQNENKLVRKSSQEIHKAVSAAPGRKDFD